MITSTLDLETVTLVPNSLIMKQAADMTLFRIIDHALVFTNTSNPREGIMMKIKLKRK